MQSYEIFKDSRNLIPHTHHGNIILIKMALTGMLYLQWQHTRIEHFHLLDFSKSMKEKEYDCI